MECKENLEAKLSLKAPKITNFNNDKSSKYFKNSMKFTHNDTERDNISKRSVRATLKPTVNLSETKSVLNENNIIVGFQKFANSSSLSAYPVSSSNNTTLSPKFVENKESEKKEVKDVSDAVDSFDSYSGEENIEEQEEEAYTANNLSNANASVSVSNLLKSQKTFISKESRDINFTANKDFRDFTTLYEIFNILYVDLKSILESRKNDSKLVEKWFEVAKNQAIGNKILSSTLSSSLKKEIEASLVLELAFLGILYKHDLGDEQVFTGFKNCFFYLYQTQVMIIYILLSSKEDDYNSFKDSKITGHSNQIKEKMNLAKCQKLVTDNSIWLSKKTIKNQHKHNNTIVKSIVENLLNVLVESKKYSCKENIENLKVLKNMLCGEFRYSTLFNLVFKQVTLKAKENQTYEVKEIIHEEISKKITANLPPIPFLPDKDLNNYKEYTLVLDLDETLVHFMEEDNNAYIQIRPGAEEFLEEMAKHYELIVFTAGMEDYAELVLNELDTDKYISHRLYRQHTIPNKNTYLKDLSLLGRDLKKTIIIDNVKENFGLQPRNGIHIKNYEGDDNDDEFLFLKKYLTDIVAHNVHDVREALDNVREKLAIRYAIENKEQLITTLRHENGF